MTSASPSPASSGARLGPALWAIGLLLAAFPWLAGYGMFYVFWFGLAVAALGAFLLVRSARPVREKALWLAGLPLVLGVLSWAAYRAATGPTHRVTYVLPPAYAGPVLAVYDPTAASGQVPTRVGGREIVQIDARGLAIVRGSSADGRLDWSFQDASGQTLTFDPNTYSGTRDVFGLATGNLGCAVPRDGSAAKSVSFVRFVVRAPSADATREAAQDSLARAAVCPPQ